MHFFREDESKEQNSQEEDLNAESCDMDIKSDGSCSILPKSNGSSSGKELGSTLHKEEPESRVRNIFLSKWIKIEVLIFCLLMIILHEIP